MDIQVKFYEGKPNNKVVKIVKDFFNLLEYEWDGEGLNLKTNVFEIVFVRMEKESISYSLKKKNININTFFSSRKRKNRM